MRRTSGSGTATVRLALVAGAGQERGWRADIRHDAYPSRVAHVLLERSRQESQGQEGTMGQFEVLARLKIREGQLEGFKRQAAELMRQAREKDTGTVAYDWYLSSDGTQCEVREAYVDADAFVEHAFDVREARDTLFGEFAYDHQMTIYGEPLPRLVELFDRVGVEVTWFTLLQALEPAGVD